MKVHQWVPALHEGDAIGGNVLYIDKLLKKEGFDPDIYAIDWDPQLEPVVKSFHDFPFNDQQPSDHVVMYHMAIPSPMTEPFKSVRAKKILVYHNITPPEYFIGIDPEIVHIAWTGRQQLQSLQSIPMACLADSEFNRKELETLGFKNTIVAPVLHDFDRKNISPANHVVNLYNDSCMNIISVGRMFPNKGFDDVIKIFYYFHKFVDNHSRLFIIGKHERGEKYLDYLKKLCDIFQLDNVIFTGHVTDNELVAYYKIADLYLAMNRHEGFCMPLLESMKFHVPVLARNTAAIPETLKGAGVLVNKLHYIEIAELTGEILHNQDLKQQIIKTQNCLLNEYYDPEVLMKKLRTILDTML